MGKQSKSWSKCEGKGKSKKKVREHLKDNPNVPQVPKVRTRVKPRTLVYPVLKARKQRQAQKLRNLHRLIATDNSNTDNSWCDDGWSYDEWNGGWRSVGWHEGWDPTSDKSASSFSLGSFDLVAMTSPKRFELVNMNLDTGAAVKHISTELSSGWSRRWKILSTSQW